MWNIIHEFESYVNKKQLQDKERLKAVRLINDISGFIRPSDQQYFRIREILFRILHRFRCWKGMAVHLRR